MRNLVRYLLLAAVISCMFLSEGCSGCAHRQRRVRDRSSRHSERVDRREDRESRRHRENGDNIEIKRDYSLDQLKALSESEDYDAMLNALEYQLKELKQLKKVYFKGDMTDNEAKEKIDEINAAYSPIIDKLSKASSDGMLTYNQHKRQMKLVGEYIKLFNSIVNDLGADFGTQFMLSR